MNTIAEIREALEKADFDDYTSYTILSSAIDQLEQAEKEVGVLRMHYSDLGISFDSMRARAERAEAALKEALERRVKALEEALGKLAAIADSHGQIPRMAEIARAEAQRDAALERVKVLSDVLSKVRDNYIIHGGKSFPRPAEIAEIDAALSPLPTEPKP